MARESVRDQAQPGNAVTDRLKSEARSLVGALGDRAVASLRGKVEGATGRLTDYAEGGGGPGMMAALTGARNLAEGKSPGRSMFGAGLAGLKEKVTGLFRRRGGGKRGGQRKLKLTNIVETIDVGVPLRPTYNQWTAYSDFPKLTKKVESVDQNKEEENKTNWKAQVFWSHRTWEATVLEQVPDERIIWRSKGQKGHVDGAVSFHEVTPNLTRILLVLEYHPQGMFERTANLWRAQGRRARLELKHFRRHMMTEGLLHADEVEGYRGTVHDGEVVESHEDAMAREEEEGGQPDESRQSAQSTQSTQSVRSRQAGDGRPLDEAEAGDRDEEVRDEAGDREPRDEADDRGLQDEADDREEDDREYEDRAAENGQAAEGRRSAGSGRPAAARRSTATRARRSASAGSERRQRNGIAARRGGST